MNFCGQHYEDSVSGLNKAFEKQSNIGIYHTLIRNKLNGTKGATSVLWITVYIKNTMQNTDRTFQSCIFKVFNEVTWAH